MKKYMLLLCLSGSVIVAASQLEDLAARVQERETALSDWRAQLSKAQPGSSDARQLRNKINQAEEFVATSRKEIEKRGGLIATAESVVVQGPAVDAGLALPSNSSTGRLSPEQGGFTDEYYDALEKAAEARVAAGAAAPTEETIVEEVKEDVIPAVIPPAPELPAEVEHKAPVAGSFLDDIIARGKEVLGITPEAAPVEEVKEEAAAVVIPPAPALPEEKQAKSGLDIARERIEAGKNAPAANLEDVEPEAVAAGQQASSAALLEDIRKGVVLRKTEHNADAVVPAAPELPEAPKTPAEELKRKFEEGGVRLRSRAEQAPLKEKLDEPTPHSRLMDEIRGRAGKPSSGSSQESIAAADRAEAAAREAEKSSIGNMSKSDVLYQAINETEQAISRSEARLASRLETKAKSEKFGLTEKIDELIAQDQQKIADLQAKLKELNAKVAQAK